MTSVRAGWHQLPKAVSTFPAGTTSRPPPIAIAIPSAGPTIGQPAAPLHRCLPVVADTPKTVPSLLPTNTIPLVTTGAVTRVPLENSQRFGPPDGSTAIRCPFCKVYMFLASKAGAEAEEKLPVEVPDDFDRISGVSGRNPRAYTEVPCSTAVLPPPP